MWHDNRPVRVLSTNSRPDRTIPIQRKCRNTTIALDQPENVYMYNKYMNGVDKHDQHRMKYGLGWFSVKYWKYLLWFLVNSSVVNAYILYWENIHKANKKELQTSWLSNWIGTWPHSWLFIQKAEIRYSTIPCTKASLRWVKSWKCENGSNKKNKAEDVNGIWCKNGPEEKLCMVASFAMFICAKMVATWHITIYNRSSKLKNTFLLVFCCFLFSLPSWKKKTKKKFNFSLFFATESSMVTFPQEIWYAARQFW